MTEALASSRDGPAKQAIMNFVARTCGEDGSTAVPPEERAAVFANDGTLWCAKPMPIQHCFPGLLLGELGLRRRDLREASKEAERDCEWFGALMHEHYAGVNQDMYGIPSERVVESSSTFAYTSDDQGGTITHKPEADYLNDGPEKSVRIWNQIGRRPLLAAGNSNGDSAMLEFTHHPNRPTLRLLLLHDDAEREFNYQVGAEQALSQAEADRWTVVSIKNDWATVFAN